MDDIAMGQNRFWKDAQRISAETGLSQEESDALIPALERALYIQRFNDEQSLTNLFNTASEYRKHYDDLSKTLQKAVVQAKQLGSSAKLLDQHYLLNAEAALADQLCNLSHTQKAYNEVETHSGFELMLAQMIEAVELASEATPRRMSKGKDYTFTTALRSLAEAYKSVTNRQPSVSKNSYFYKLTVYFMRDVLAFEIEDPSRHISNMFHS